MNEHEIVEIPVEDTRGLAPMEATSVDALIKAAENAATMVEAYKKFRRATLGMMNSSDWVDQEGKPYPQSSGLEKVADPLGISFGFIGPQTKIELGDRYLIETKLWFSSSWRRIEVVGFRASDDPLYAKRGGVLLPMHEVDEADIRKASYTNCIARGLSIMLGLRNMTWEELGEYGVTEAGAQKIERKTQTPQTKEEQDKVNQVREWLTEMSGGNAKKALEELERVTQFEGKTGPVPGLKSFGKLKGKRLDVTYGIVKDMHDIWQAEVAQSAREEE